MNQQQERTIKILNCNPLKLNELQLICIIVRYSSKIQGERAGTNYGKPNPYQSMVGAEKNPKNNLNTQGHVQSVTTTTTVTMWMMTLFQTMTAQ